MPTKTFIVLFTSSLMLLGFIWGFANYTNLQNNGKLKDLYKEPAIAKKHAKHNNLNFEDFSRKAIDIKEEAFPTPTINEKYKSGFSLKKEENKITYSSFSRASIRMKKIAMPAIIEDSIVKVSNYNKDSVVALVDTLYN